jgi:hypothetical protein
MDDSSSGHVTLMLTIAAVVLPQVNYPFLMIIITSRLANDNLLYYLYPKLIGYNNYDLEICVDNPWRHYSSNRIKGPTWLIRLDMTKIG